MAVDIREEVPCELCGAGIVKGLVKSFPGGYVCVDCCELLENQDYLEVEENNDATE